MPQYGHIEFGSLKNFLETPPKKKTYRVDINYSKNSLIITDKEGTFSVPIDEANELVPISLLVYEKLSPAEMVKVIRDLRELAARKVRTQRVTLCYYKREARKHGADYDNVIEYYYPIEFENFQEMLAKFFLMVHYDVGPGFNWRKYCVGICSKATDGHERSGTGLHMPMLDYDGKNIKRLVKKDIKILQEKFGLGAAHLYRTRRGIHIYFPTDLVSWETFAEILKNAKCCSGFRKVSLKKQSAVLRVSAKYTDFDISRLERIYPKRSGTPKRPHLQGLTAAFLIGLGEQCDTHMASLFPQWCLYQEDSKPWKPGPPKPPRKKVTSLKKTLESEKVLKANPVNKYVLKPKTDQWGSVWKQDYSYAPANSSTAITTDTSSIWYDPPKEGNGQ